MSAQEPRLQAGHEVLISITNVPAEQAREINGAYPIDNDGLVKIPYLGKIPAKGKTPSQLGDLIEEKYKTGQIFTRASVIGKVAAGLRVGVGGEVRRPGLHGYHQGMRVSEAITSAGGYTDFAKGRIIIVRAGKKYQITRRQIAADPDKDAVIRPGDRLEVE